MKYIYLLLILLLSQCDAVNIVPLSIEASNKNKNISLIEKYIEDPYQVDGKWFYPRDYKSSVEVGIAEIELDLNNKKPSYLALKQDECNATVEVTEKTGIEIVNTEIFDVNVCKKEIYKIVN